jgi:hypothetical protein
MAADSAEFFPTCLAVIDGVKAGIDQAKAPMALEAPNAVQNSSLFVH